MIRRYFVVLFLLVTACSKFALSDPRDIHGVDPAFQSYVEIYVQAKGSPLRYDIPIGFKNLTSPTIGLCIRWGNMYREILVDPTYWNDSYTSENERIALIFHEFGHCDLNRDHDTDLLPDGEPESLMYPYDVGFSSSMKSYYFNELFHPEAITAVTRNSKTTVINNDVINFPANVQ